MITFKHKLPIYLIIAFGLLLMCGFISGCGAGNSDNIPPGQVKKYTGTVIGTITDENGSTLAGAEVKIIVKSDIIIADVSDADGNFTLENVPEGDQVLYASCPGYQDSSVELVVEADETVRKDISMNAIPPTTGNLQGVVTDDSTGNPIEGSVIYVNSLADSTDGNGAYSINGIPQGENIAVTVVKPGFQDFTGNVNVVGGETTNLDIAMTPNPSKTAGRIIDINGQGISGVQVSYNGTSTSTDPNGDYVLENVPPGNYTLQAERLGYTTKTENISVGTNQQLVVNFTLECRIAFASTRDGNYEIYTMNPDGTDQQRLTNNTSFDCYPAWSPDRSLIAFASEQSGNREIYVMNSDGTNQVRLTNLVSSDAAPIWSPDGSRIAFSAGFGGGNFEIYVMNADGSGLVRLTDNTWDDSHPTWSPDGSKLAFHSNEVSSYEIYTMNIDGSNLARLTNDAVADFGPAWSPDGAKIAFTSSWQIYTMNSDGSGRVRLTDNAFQDHAASWSIDGQKIVFHSDRDGNNGIFMIRNDGSGLFKLSLDANYDTYPAWGP